MSPNACLLHGVTRVVVRCTHRPQSHELAAVERLCNTNEEANGTRTGTRAHAPSDVGQTGPT
jgi:hypothetical protein